MMIVLWTKINDLNVLCAIPGGVPGFSMFKTDQWVSKLIK